MVKCVLFFLFGLLISCGEVEKGKKFSTKFTQIGNVSVFEWENHKFSVSFDFPRNLDTTFDKNHSFLRIIDASQNIDLWKFDINQVSIWGINGDILPNLMRISQNSIVVPGENAPLEKVLALEFSRIILTPDFSSETILKLIKYYKKTLVNIQFGVPYILETDGIFWHEVH